MDLTLIKQARMRIAQAPRELEYYRTKVKMEIFMALRSYVEASYTSEFSRPDCGRIATEAVNQLCGEVPVGHPPLLAQEIRAAVEEVVTEIKKTGSDVKIAAAFIRWTKAASQLMRFKNQLAEINLNMALELDPRSAFAYTSLAYLAGFKGDYKRAIELATKATELNPEIPEAWTELANAYQNVGQEELMQFAFQKAQALINRK